MAGGRLRLDRRREVHDLERLGAELDATVASFDWVMSGLRAEPEVWAQVEMPVERQIPGWYELDWDHVERGRQLYEPLPGPKVVIDATDSVDDDLPHVQQHLADRQLSIT